MILGMSSYIIFDRFYPNPLGVHTVVLPILISLAGFVVVSIFTNSKSNSFVLEK
jgi:sodium/pantothenate symporter